jgi:hypothetical protein
VRRRLGGINFPNGSIHWPLAVLGRTQFVSLINIGIDKAFSSVFRRSSMLALRYLQCRPATILQKSRFARRSSKSDGLHEALQL